MNGHGNTNDDDDDIDDMDAAAQNRADSSGGSLIPKEKALPNVLQWLVNAYDMAPGHALPKREVYGDYLAFCRDHQLEATNAPAFGKILRMVFPDITSRRLGRRGQTSHHYNHFRRRPAGQAPAHLHLTGGLLSALTAGLGWTAAASSSSPTLSSTSSSSSSSSSSSTTTTTLPTHHHHHHHQHHLLHHQQHQQHHYQQRHDHPGTSSGSGGGGGGAGEEPPPFSTLAAGRRSPHPLLPPPVASGFPHPHPLPPPSFDEAQRRANPFSSFSYSSSEVAPSSLLAVPRVSAVGGGGEMPHFALSAHQLHPDFKQDAESFSSLYRSHQQEVCGVMSGAYLNYEVLQSALCAFYPQMKKYHHLLSSQAIVDQIADSDLQFYGWVVGQLVPDVLADTSEDRLSRLLHLAESFVPLLKSAMTYSLPPALAESKARTALNFSKTLRSRAVVARLSTRLRAVLEHDAGREEVQAMTAGWHRLDFDFIDEKTAIYGRFRHIAMTFREGFTVLLLQQRRRLDDWSAWLMRLAESVAKGEFESQAQSMGDFLMKWGVYSHLVLCNLAVLRAERMETFYLLFDWVQTLLALCLEEQEIAGALRRRHAPYRPLQGEVERGRVDHGADGRGNDDSGRAAGKDQPSRLMAHHHQQPQPQREETEKEGAPKRAPYAPTAGDDFSDF